MELKHIKELMAVMQRTGTKRLVIKQKDIELELERETSLTSQEKELTSFPEISLSRTEAALQRAHTLVPKGSDLSSTVVVGSNKKDIETISQGLFITSPMVGTFYGSPGPDEPAFIKVGDRVEKDTVVCIIEAMKVMNEVKAGIAGIVVENLVPSGHPVEFSTKLFRINPVNE